MSGKKSHKQLIQLATEQGWEADISGGGHWRLRKGGQTIFMAYSPSDHRAYQRARTIMRRYGIQV